MVMILYALCGAMVFVVGGWKKSTPWGRAKKNLVATPHLDENFPSQLP